MTMMHAHLMHFSWSVEPTAGLLSIYKIGENGELTSPMNFFKKKCEKILVVQKMVVILHRFCAKNEAH